MIESINFLKLKVKTQLEFSVIDIKKWGQKNRLGELIKGEFVELIKAKKALMLPIWFKPKAIFISHFQKWLLADMKKEYNTLLLYKCEYSSCTRKDKYCERTTKIRTLSVKIGRKIHVLLERSWKVQM